MCGLAPGVRCSIAWSVTFGVILGVRVGGRLQYAVLESSLSTVVA
jgi:hypothetical protein